MIFDIQKEITMANMLALHSIRAGIEIGQRIQSSAAQDLTGTAQVLPLPAGTCAVAGQSGKAA